MPFLLIAEDDPDDQLLIKYALEDACASDVETYYVNDGFELIDFLKENVDRQSAQPDLVLLDLNMPRKDGRAALKEIKTNPELADVPVAVLTTSLNSADAFYCQQYGIVGYYNKPNSMTELRSIMNSLCSTYLK